MPPKPLEHGFLLPVLLDTESHLYGRWDYLAGAWSQGKLPDAPLPRIDFLDSPDKATWHMITRCLDAIPNHGRGGGWEGWGSFEYFHFFLEWLLYGFHHHGHATPPKEPAGCEGASERLKQQLDLALWLAHPYDYLGDLLAENAYGKRRGFFPTPHSLASLMSQLTIGISEGDARILSVCDPCVGTGRLLLHASNYSMRLYGQDVDPVMCMATLVHGYLFAPWLVKPLPFLDGAHYRPEHTAAVSESLTAQAPPHVVAVLADTEHDTENAWKFEPVKKRRKKSGGAEPVIKQGLLFEP